MDYEQSHPWIKFSLNLAHADPMLWLGFGEVASKIEHMAGVPLKPEVANELNQIYLTKGILATTAIEGNTLSEDQVRRVIDKELKLPPSQHYLEQEVLNILALCNDEVKALMDHREQKPQLGLDLIRTYNSRVLDKLEVDDGVTPGEFRNHSVLVGSVYRGAPAKDCPYLVERLCGWLNGPDFETPTSDLKVPYALVKAIVAHIYLAWIHPFGDGNGRTARMVEFHILFSSGIPMPAAHLLSDHYNKTRTQYYRELDRASKSGGDIIPFIKYAIVGFLDGLREQLQRIKQQQLRVAWENYVHEVFGEARISPTQKRRRDLVLEMSKFDWLEVAKIPEMTTKLARLYATAGDRMLQRDLNSVHKLNLVERHYGKARARKTIIEAFLPWKVAD